MEFGVVERMKGDTGHREVLISLAAVKLPQNDYSAGERLNVQS